MKKHITAVAAIAGSLLLAPVLMNQANAGGHGGGMGHMGGGMGHMGGGMGTWAAAHMGGGMGHMAAAWATWAAEHISPEGTWAPATLAEAE